MNNKSFMVTGATGFIGSHLVKKLYNLNHKVSIIVRPDSNLDILNDLQGEIIIYKHNGTTEQLIEILEEAKPEVVIHLASYFVSEHGLNDIFGLINSNIFFGTQLLEAMTKNHVKHLINTGTSWQHYNNEVYNPVCLYAATKQAFEDIIKFYTETTPLRAITLKLFDTYGPNDPRKKLFNILRESAKNGKRISMSPGEQKLDLTYIDDVLEAYIIACHQVFNENAHIYKEFMVSLGEQISLKDLVKLYENVTNQKLCIDWGKRPYRKREVMVPWEKGETLPNWSPKVKLSQGILRMERSGKVN